MPRQICKTAYGKNYLERTYLHIERSWRPGFNQLVMNYLRYSDRCWHETCTFGRQGFYKEDTDDIQGITAVGTHPIYSRGVYRNVSSTKHRALPLCRRLLAEPRRW